MKDAYQISESVRLGVLLALSGGFMDAYSYLERGHVFANAQTGNILLLGVHIAEGNFRSAANYLLPVLAFAWGIFLAEMIHVRRLSILHWRQTAVLLEGLILVGVSFFPLTMNLPANALTSFACGIQVECFRKVHGQGIATTMCIGNLRSGTENLHRYVHTRKIQPLKKAVFYYGIIFCFVIGAIAGNFLIKLLGQRAILLCSAALFTAFFLMFIDREKD